VIISVAVIVISGKVVFSTEGVLNGYIAQEPEGDSGFGYDPVFWIPSLSRTFAQLSSEEKNRISQEIVKPEKRDKHHLDKLFKNQKFG
jgi:XTP/dITP diphosphohydrolase